MVPLSLLGMHTASKQLAAKQMLNAISLFAFFCKSENLQISFS